MRLLMPEAVEGLEVYDESFIPEHFLVATPHYET